MNKKKFNQYILVIFVIGVISGGIVFLNSIAFVPTTQLDDDAPTTQLDAIESYRSISIP